MGCILINDRPSIPALPSFHDYSLTGYAVDGEREEIRLSLRWRDEPQGRFPDTTVIFSGVAAYFFEEDQGMNILFDIEEFPLAQCLNAQAAFFDAKKGYGWPRFWQGGHEAALAALTQQGVRAFDISSSYGMCGWILAQAVHHQVLNDAAEPGAAPDQASRP